MTTSMIYLAGDVHGKFGHILPAIVRSDPERKITQKAVIFLGDIEPKHRFGVEIRALVEADIAVWFIHGNHDTDHSRTWDFLADSQHRNLHGRVVEICGLRVAGLGGIFRGEIWYPQHELGEPNFHTYREYEKKKRSWQRTRAGLDADDSMRESGVLLKHRSSIFHDEFMALGSMNADILVTHEAPNCHPHGFVAITELAQAMRVRTLFHGHHHDNRDYRDYNDRHGFQSFGVGLRGIKDVDGNDILRGELDDRRGYFGI